MNSQQYPSATTVRALNTPAGQGNRLIMRLKRGLITLLILVILLATTGMGYQLIATRSDERSYLPAGQLTNVGGYMLHIHCMGSGSPAIILESGLGGTSMDWSLVQPELAKVTRVCSYDRAGLGWSEPNPADTPRTSRLVAQELHTLLRNTGVTGPYILAGLSAGGMHVQMYANLYPQEVSGLMLVDPTPAQLMATFTNEERQALLPNLDQFRLIQRLESFGLLRILPLPASESLSKLPSETRDAIRAVNLRTGAADALYREAAGFESSIMQIGSIKPSQLPLTVIWHGIPAEPLDLEPLAESSLRELVAHSKDGKFMIAENSGHYITFDRPDVVISQLIAMLKTLRSENKSNLFKLGLRNNHGPYSK